MKENQKVLVKKFLHAVKSSVMAMDVDTLKEDQIKEMFDAFSALVKECK